MRKIHNHVFSLPPLELECMKALWVLGEANVHGIRGRLWDFRPLAYTTIMTVMERLARKGVVERRREGRFHIYRPLVSNGEVREHAVGRLINDFFLGSREALREYLDGNGAEKLSMAESAFGSRNSPGKPRLEHEEEKRGRTDDGIDPSLL
jgi:BlaI family transcriptional regulator, penicillinase repressor